LEAHPELGFTYSGYLDSHSGSDGKIVPGPLVEPPQVPDEELYVRLLETNLIPACSLLVRTACYRELGPYDEGEVLSEDYEMNLRLARTYRGRPVPGATFCFRRHAEPRGNQLLRIPTNRLAEARRERSRQRFQQLRAELDLADYLPKPPQETPAAALDTRRALLQRATVMAASRLHEEMLEDLGAALAGPNASRPLSTAECEMLSRLPQYPLRTDKVFFSRQHLRRIQAACEAHPIGREIKFHLTRGFYWRAAAHWRRGNWRHATRSILALLQLNSVGDLISTARVRLARQSRRHTPRAQ
jgi:hypothetical protein